MEERSGRDLWPSLPLHGLSQHPQSHPQQPIPRAQSDLFVLSGLKIEYCYYCYSREKKNIICPSSHIFQIIES